MSYGIVDIIAIIASAIISSMGLGGGGVLILYLTLFKDTPQLNAQGLNLLFFIPCAIVALIIYTKRKMIEYKILVPIISGGIIGVGVGKLLLDMINPAYLKIAFALFLIVVGLYTVFSKKKS